MSQFFGITRERVFSPGRVEDDRAILQMAADHLEQRGHRVTVLSGDDACWPAPESGAVVFTMCQGTRALERLRQWAARGVRIINSPDGILNCQRHRTIPALAQAGIPFPESVIVDTGAPPVLPAWVADGGAWIKRGDVHATEADDVIHVCGVAAARAALQRLCGRGIGRAVVQRHVPGTVVKFYAVRARFFHCVHSSNGAAVTAESAPRIDAMSRQAAQALNIEIYGGDCVCELNGGVSIIDLNDWPSYAACRAQAAGEIAAYLDAQSCE